MTKATPASSESTNLTRLWYRLYLKRKAEGMALNPV
ncbi:hypothetical protein FOPG_19769 [Fusarium oxysporum f. sp. conglutinans race 2 54008]|uniref:Uncharacterized protein n=1 Tax=Fusarium oxysporum f. sp. conglutinans race 2 54008 TaxID=1089457 RepID=X0GVW8_FUSOX|nr:hypothetical protein FOPG_19769 [Fusarium oxysporum f. sp. conglutinans race 2 54008]